MFLCFSIENLGWDAFHGKGNFASLTLDEENCIITYNGVKDIITGGVKPIAIQAWVQ